MLHLSKLYRSTKESRHLFSYLEPGSFPAGKCLPSVGAVFKVHNIMPLVPRVNFVHTDSRRHLGILYFDSIFQRSSRHENVKFKHTHMTFPLCMSIRYKQTDSTNNLLKEIKAKEYVTLYLNKRTRVFRIFCRSAKIATVSFVAVAPITIGAALVDMLPLQSAISFAGCLAFYALLLTGQSYVFMSRVVCKLMISTDDSYMRVSHLTLFGNRRDIYVRISDIIPISGSIYDRKFHTFRFKNSSRKLFFLPQEGGSDTDFEALEMFFTRRDKEKAKE